MRSYIKGYWYDCIVISIFLVIILVIYFTNLYGNFWVSGWDNLHPEFNYKVNLSRAIFSSWQEYQGLGLPAGHGHASEFFREILLFFFTTLLNTQITRKIFIILILFSGVTGVYCFIRNCILKNNDLLSKISLSFLGAIFYLFHIATVQIFYTPYEAFLIHYGMLPWMVFSVFYFYETKTKKAFRIFILCHIIGSAQFYIPTLFIVYMMVIFVLTLGLFFGSNIKSSFKYILIIYGSILIINFYWLLPFIYFTLNNISSQVNAYLNYVFSTDIYLKNVKYGGIFDTALLKGFLFDAVDLQNGGEYDYLNKPWRIQMQQWPILLIGYMLFFIVILGMIDRIRKKDKLSFVTLFIILFSLLTIQTYPFNLINEVIRRIPIFHQIFRNPYTKFANSLLFVESILYVYGIQILISSISKIIQGYKRQQLILTVSIIILFFQIAYIYPILNGNFIYQKLKIQIPDDYFQVFEYFNNEKDGRIANFPQFTSNGWNFYKWGYGGSGFLWYGIKQPILDRAFDVWHKNNENYYWEISKAIYSGDINQFEGILEKYQINWLLVDENIIDFSSVRPSYFDKFEELINNSRKVNLSAVKGKIKIYKVDLNNSIKDFILLGKGLTSVGPRYNWNNFDRAFLDYGNYLSSEDQTLNSIYYPFRSLFSGRKQQELEYQVVDNGEYYSFKSKIPKYFVESKLVIPILDNEEVTEIYSQDISQSKKLFPSIFLDNEYISYNGTYESTSSAMISSEEIILPYIKDGQLEIRVPKIKGYFSYDSSINNEIFNKNPMNCDRFNYGYYQHDIVDLFGKQLLRLTSLGSSNCLDVDIPQLAHRLGYLLSIENRHIDGKSLLFRILNKNSQRFDLETYLSDQSDIFYSNDFKLSDPNPITSYFVIPPMEEFGRGYTLHFDNTSIGKVKTVNDLGKITVNPIPYRFLSGLKVVKGQISDEKEKSTSSASDFTVNHPNPSYYEVEITDPKILEYGNYLILSQSYDKGWHAYNIGSKTPSSKLQSLLITNLPFLFGEEIKDHVLVNNWENGWKLNNETMKQCYNGRCDVVIIYLPQYLEYLGFALLGGLFIYMLILFQKDERP